MWERRQKAALDDNRLTERDLTRMRESESGCQIPPDSLSLIRVVLRPFGFKCRNFVIERDLIISHQFFKLKTNSYNEKVSHHTAFFRHFNILLPESLLNI